METKPDSGLSKMGGHKGRPYRIDIGADAPCGRPVDRDIKFSNSQGNFQQFQ